MEMDEIVTVILNQDGIDSMELVIGMMNDGIGITTLLSSTPQSTTTLASKSVLTSQYPSPQPGTTTSNSTSK
jgi:hypothetical protein